MSLNTTTNSVIAATAVTEKITESTAARFADALLALLRRQNPDAPADLFGLAHELALASERGDVCVHVPAHTDCAAWLASKLVGEAGSFSPLILSKQRLYLARYFAYESRLAEQLLLLAADKPAALDENLLRAQLMHYFPDSGKETDWQQVAVASAMLQRLTLISGGPGTGKTTTLIKLLALLQTMASGGAESAAKPLPIAPAAKPLQIVLAAPTGKAAMRMQEAILQGKQKLLASGLLSIELAAQIPDRASTLHRLLGSRHHAVQFRHHAKNPLLLDVLVLDEASMIDLALMSKLVDALPSHARLILLGDKDQLASVEAGAVMGDLCAGAGMSPEFAAKLSRLTGATIAPSFAESRLGEHVQTLHKSYRFSGPIAELAKAMNRGDIRKVSELLHEARLASDAVPAVNLVANTKMKSPIIWLPTNPATAGQAILPPMMAGYAAFFTAVATNAAPLTVFAAFDAFRVLSPIRQGAASVARVNAMIEAQLTKQGVRMSEQTWYAGRPVLVPQNLYELELYNGDIGLTLPDEHGKLWVHFPVAASEGGEAGTRKIATARLPAVETAFAMTVHKSQGSEFEHVMLLMPSPAEGRSHLSRELVYTAITRAKNKVTLWGEESVITNASRRSVERQSGLAARLLIGISS